MQFAVQDMGGKLQAAMYYVLRLLLKEAWIALCRHDQDVHLNVSIPAGRCWLKGIA